METTGNQAAASVTMVALANIQPSSYNPRKNFDEEKLNELAESIRQQGVIQPIGIRPIDGSENFEIIFGERRYRASVIAGLSEIPALVMNVSTETAKEMAITENLQRKDISPIEEAHAYQQLLDSGHHDTKSLAVQFSKNETYIRTRLKFNNLIPEFALLLENDELTISAASEICRYSESIQQDLYEKHFKNTAGYGTWRGMKASELAKNIEQHYTTDLMRFHFDKSKCLSCPHNTNNMELFCDGSCGSCANRSCLAERNTDFIVKKAVQILETHPTFSLGYNEFNCDETAVNRLAELGYELEKLSFSQKQYPQAPQQPLREEYETEEEFQQDIVRYDQAVEQYAGQCKELVRKSEEGEISLYAQIGHYDITLCYIDVAKQGNIKNSEQLTEIQKLEKKDIRNKEIAHEKTVKDTKEQILNADITESKFGADEDKMMYFFLLSSLRKEHFPIVGIEEEHSPYLTGEEKIQIIANLTPKAKAVIRRDFLIENFKTGYSDDAVAQLLIEFAQKHMPEELAEIKNAYDTEYEKRHQRIEEKKAVIKEHKEGKTAKSKADKATKPKQPKEQEAAA